MDSACIHRARLVLPARATVRNAQGEYDEPDTDEAPRGPWFAARLMETTGAPAKNRRQPGSADARVVEPYELLAMPAAEDGSPVELTASSLVETDCPLLGSPTLLLAGRPEKLNDGETHIGWRALANVPADAA